MPHRARPPSVAFVKRSCLLPADGFYDWEQAKDPATGKVRKQPYFINPEDMQVMALAGLYEYWRKPEVQRDDEGGRAANRMRSIRPRQSR
ncbi:SOS response-associated peptidase family protein [Streptomyces mirabilis]|uniref:SOS response-associated peptidase family protein n=1 Tax=Streptomyces mirabilis TaxID=68239 RepID=UPI0036BC0E53